MFVGDTDSVKYYHDTTISGHNGNLSVCFIGETDIDVKMLSGGERNMTYLEGETAFMECSASGVPSPTTRWTYQHYNEGIVTSVVILRNIQYILYVFIMNNAKLGYNHCIAWVI